MNYPTYPVEIEEVKYSNYANAKLYLTRFVEDNRPVLFIGNADDEAIYIICNINTDEYQLKEFDFAIKNYSENEGILNWLVDNGYIEKPHDQFKTGWVMIQICSATKKLKERMIKICQNE